MSGIPVPRSLLTHRAAGSLNWDDGAMTDPDGSGFGCDFCADDQNRFYGHLPQRGSDEARQMILLRCPRCATYYENSVQGEDKTRRLTRQEADSLYPAHD